MSAAAVLTGAARRTGRGCALLLLLACASWGGAQVGASGAGEGAPASAPAGLADVQRTLNEGRTEAALREVEALPAQGGRSRLRGEILYALGRLREADQELEHAVAEDPKDLAAVQLRGVVLFREGRSAEAIPLLERAHTWDVHTQADPAYVLALCYIDAHRFDDARHAFAAQYGLKPDDAPAHLLAARMLLRREYLPTAKAEAERAAQLDPRLPLVHHLLGELALAGDQLAAAAAEFEQERQINPLEGSTYDRLGDVYSRLGEYSRAERMLQQAVLLEPSSTGPYILLGKVLLRQGELQSAAGYLERAQAMDPANFQTHNLLAQVYRGMGRMPEAKEQAALAQKLQAAPMLQLQTVK